MLKVFFAVVLILGMGSAAAEAPAAPQGLASGVVHLTPLTPPHSLVGEASGVLEIMCQGAAEPGGIIRLRSSGAKGLDSLTAFLTDSAGTVLSAAATFKLVPDAAQSPWEALLGVPSNAPVGTCIVEAFVTVHGQSGLLSGAVSITAKRFASETIPLDEALTALRLTPDPRKTEEAVALRNLLGGEHVSASLETGMLEMPVQGGVRSAGFGDRRIYRHAGGGFDYSIHNGVDIALPEGVLVASCGRGRVAFAAPRIITGNSVVVEHFPGLYSVYFHLSSILVKEGDVVEKGQILGAVGKTGFATGPHLHWEMEIRDTAVDPDNALRVLNSLNP